MKAVPSDPENPLLKNFYLFIASNEKQKHKKMRTEKQKHPFRSASRILCCDYFCSSQCKLCVLFSLLFYIILKCERFELSCVN